MRRIKDKERGAVAVTVALLMVVVLGMAAIVIDLGKVYAERAQLQNGADAAALAIAQDCAGSHCGTYASTATTLAGANANDGKANAQATINGAAHTVTVETSTLTSENKTAVQHWFAPIIGVPETAVRATAVASWEGTGDPSAFPFVLAQCQIQEVYGRQLVEFFKKSKTPRGCPPAPPGGFAKLAESDGACSAAIDFGNASVESSNGNAFKAPCDQLLQSWMEDILNSDPPTGLFPVYDSVDGKSYRLSGFAVFEIHGWSFKQGGSHKEPISFRDNYYGGFNCGNDICVIGKFQKFVSWDQRHTIATNPIIKLIG